MPQTSAFPASIPYLAKVPLELQCTCSDGGFDQAWVHVAGELDIATASLLEQALDRAAHRAQLVVLDLRELTFMDSAGLHVIVSASNGARQARRRLVLARGRSQFDRLFALTGAADLLEISDLDPLD